MERIETVDKLFVHELNDLRSAEEQLVGALPLMAASASAPELRQAFEKHLEQTRTQLQRVEEALRLMQERPNGDTCDGMKGLIGEGQKMMDAVTRGAVLDSALIDAGRKVEHYEITAYRSAVSRAHELGHDVVAALLETNLQEEELADDRLQQLAQGMMPYSGPGADPRDDGSEVIVGSGASHAPGAK